MRWKYTPGLSVYTKLPDFFKYHRFSRIFFFFLSFRENSFLSFSSFPYYLSTIFKETDTTCENVQRIVVLMIKTQGFDSNSLLEARFHIFNEKEIHRWLFNHRAEQRGRDKIADTYFRNTYLPSLNDLQHSSPCIDSFYRANIQKPFFRNKGGGQRFNESA